MSLLRVLNAHHLVRSIAKRSNQRCTFIYKIKRSFSGNIEQIVVPNLGDSITEGTVTAIHKQIGEQVVEDDVVLEIETDKVSVDIRAPKMGFIATFFAEIDQDVEVGAPLYALSAEAVDGIDPASIKPQEAAKSEEAPASTQSAAPTPTPPPPSAQSTAPSQTQPHRIPMITFRHGLREQIDKVIHGISKPVAKASGLSEGTIPFWELPQEFRPRGWKEIEIDMVNSGGADVVKSNYD